MKRGALFRSASFQDATEADIARLDALGVRFLVDLRRPEERKFEPNRWPGEACRTIANDEGAGTANSRRIWRFCCKAISRPRRSREYMHNVYRAFPFDPRHIALYRDWLRELGEGGPGVIHCAAGKDRTGLGCALTLLALGVAEEDVFADYEFTNVAMDVETRMPRIQARMEERLQRKLDADALRPMLGVNVDYLRSALDAIAAKHGSVDAYLESALGVSPKRGNACGKTSSLRRRLPAAPARRRSAAGSCSRPRPRRRYKAVTSTTAW